MGVSDSNFILAIGTVLLQIATVGLLTIFFLRSRVAVAADVSNVIGEWALRVAFIFTLAGSALTLVYSEIIGFPPCPLCWWQRVFLYPQVVIFALALWRREHSSVATYSIALSILGFGVATYHHLLQVLPAGSLPCPANGVVSCAQRYVFEFGYVTFPMMSASLFAFLVVLMFFVYTRQR